MKSKSILITTILFVLFATNLFAQNIIPQKGTVTHNDKTRPCIQVNVDPEPKTLKEAWKDFLKDNYDFKLKGIGFLTNKDLLSAEQVVVENISAKSMDFYTRIVEDENGSEMKVFASFGYDIYIDKENMPQEYNALRKMLEKFLKSYLPKYQLDLVKETEKRIKELTKEKNDLKEDIEDGEQEIDDLKKEIKDLTAKLKSNKSKLELAEIKLERRQEKLEQIKMKLK